MVVCPPTRYLVFFQYFGTKYSGVMETSNDQSVLGVQNYLEKAVQNLKPVAPVKFHISSRTDTGVHALCNSAHLDIQRAPGKPAFEEKQLVHGLNRHLKPEPICILNAHRVPSTFHARFSALSRTYIYRLLMGCSHSEIPVFERDLCWAPGGGYLNVPAMQEAAQFLVGTHDFSTFRSLSSETPFRSPVRTVFEVDIQPSSGFLSHHYEHRYCLVLDSAHALPPRAKPVTVDQFSIVARLCSAISVAELVVWLCDTGTYHQRASAPALHHKEKTGPDGPLASPHGAAVRRMAGALVAVGQGKLTPHRIKELLELKDSRAFPSNAMAPPSGLFLKSVEYSEADLDTAGAPGE